MRPLTGVPGPVAVPSTTLLPGHLRMIFRWTYDDPIFGARGEGVARVAPPDSVRLDFFVDGGVGSGGAILIGDTLRTAAEDGRRYLPPVPLLWAALGVMRVTGQDTTVLIDGDTLRAEVGVGQVFRMAFVGRRMVSLSRIEGGRLREQVVVDSSKISYRNFAARRRLTLTEVRRVSDAPYDPAIWRP